MYKFLLFSKSKKNINGEQHQTYMRNTVNIKDIAVLIICCIHVKWKVVYDRIEPFRYVVDSYDSLGYKHWIMTCGSLYTNEMKFLIR